MYVIGEDWGPCMVCGKERDRRYGVCFKCSDHVLSDGVYAWDDRNPDVRWTVKPPYLFKEEEAP